MNKTIWLFSYTQLLKRLQIHIIYVIIRTMFTQDIGDMFSRLGFKETEAKIYLTCLKSQGGLHVQKIVKETGIKWSSAKLILERLIDKGFITFHLEENRKVYTAENPSKILYNLQETADSFKNILPLLSVSQFGGKPSRVRFFEGDEVIKNIYNDILLTLKYEEGKRKEYLAISSSVDIYNHDPGYLDRFVAKRVKYQIPVRWLARKAELRHKPFAQTPEKYLRTMKFIDDKKYPFHMEIAIYADKVALMSFEGIPAGIIIENEKLAQSFRSIFNFFWDSIK